MVDVSAYKVGVVLSLDECGMARGKPLKACKVNVGGESNPVTIVTSASNVREGSRVAVAPSGTTVLNEEGEEMMLKDTTVGGVVSEGVLCDSRMLGWQGGAEGLAVQIPENFELGSAPPSSKPRGGKEPSQEEIPPTEVKGLFEKKLTKEEKKKLAAEKRAAKKAGKET